ncbi:hypothetical protein WN51_05487 [Melipona quadrifasciata]|uniref:Uncharacterized protein n=1 Tax=Melipona quadrifasciata TaxID=166423 RepID=A0A0N0U7U6_9HYME|nr:hypothetical protein WN51_05487 [Melipona quadrifasciata]
MGQCQSEWSLIITEENVVTGKRLESAVSNRLGDRESSTEIEYRKENRRWGRDLDRGADLQFLLVFEKMHVLIIDALVPKWHGIRMTHEPLEAPLQPRWRRY